MHHSCWLYSPFWIYSFWYGRVSAQKHYNYMKWFFSVRTTSLAWKYSTGPQLCNCATLVSEQVMRVGICCCILFLFMYSRWHINFYGLMKEWSNNVSTLFCTRSGGRDWYCSCYCGSSLPHWNKTSLNAELLGFLLYSIYLPAPCCTTFSSQRSLTLRLYRSSQPWIQDRLSV